MKILVRFDDICPTMDFTQFKRATDCKSLTPI